MKEQRVKEIVNDIIRNIYLDIESMVAQKIVIAEKNMVSKIGASLQANYPPLSHKYLEDKITKLQRETRQSIHVCENEDCPHHSEEALTSCNGDPFECKKYITMRRNR